MNWFDDLETTILAIATKLGVWLTPLVPAYFVQRAMVQRLETPPAWGWIAAAALEIVGLSATKTLLRAYTWNQEKRKTDPAAPLGWNIVAAAVYYLTALLLVLVIEYYPGAVRLAPAAFVILSGTAALVIALSADHNRRQRLVIDLSVERSAKRSAVRPPSAPNRSTPGQHPDSDRLQAGRKRQQQLAEQRLLTYLADHPHASHSEAAAIVGRSRPWVTGKINQFEQAGLISKNGAGVVINR